MENARLAAAYQAYFEEMLGLPLRDGLCKKSDALLRGCPPFLLGCLAMEMHGAHGVTRAEAPCADALPIKAYRKENAIQYAILIPDTEFQGSHRASPILKGEKVSGAARLPNIALAFGIRRAGAVVSWASAADMGGVWNITVETQISFRGNGFAGDCLRALTASLLREGKAPIYLCEVTNAASSHTALKAGYRPYGMLLRWMP